MNTSTWLPGVVDGRRGRWVLRHAVWHWVPSPLPYAHLVVEQEIARRQRGAA